MTVLCQDWASNENNLKGRLIMLHFRLANVLRRNLIVSVLGLPYLIYYRIIVEWILGVEMQMTLSIGARCRLEHGQGLVVNSKAIIGSDCMLRQNVTIGNKLKKDGTYSASPIIGNHCDIGAGAIIIGEIRIGNNVSIGAGAVVVKDVPDNSIVIGNPMRIISKNR